MKAIEFKPIDELKEFKKFGDSFVQVEKFDNNIYLYKRTFGPDNKYWCYELVKGGKTQKSKWTSDLCISLYKQLGTFRF